MVAIKSNLLGKKQDAFKRIFAGFTFGAYQSSAIGVNIMKIIALYCLCGTNVLQFKCSFTLP